MISYETKKAIIDVWLAGKDLGLNKTEIGKRFGLSRDRVRRVIDEYNRKRAPVPTQAKILEDILAVLQGGDVRATISAKQLHDTHTVLVIPDMHAPFQHPDALAFLKAVRTKYKPTKFVCLGDEIDAHAFSKYPKDPDGLSAGAEMTKAREALIPFYVEFPEMLVCESNHSVRPWKMAFQAGLPASFLPAYSTFLNAPDRWLWASHHEIDGVRYIHGEGKSGFNAHIHFMRAYKQSVVIGHIHSYAAVSHEGGLFAVNSGCLIDTTAYCFRYAKNMPIPVSLGCSIIHHGKRAEFIPMQIDSHGRWVGKLE